MTRFARAKGSKSSNERLPEQATSWSEMKQQLVEKNKEIESSKQRQEANNKRNANYKAFLDEKAAEQTKNPKWADFPGVSKTPIPNKKRVKQNVFPLKASSSVQKNISLENEEGSSDDEAFVELKAKLDKVLDKQELDQSEPHDSDAAEGEVGLTKPVKSPVSNVKITGSKKKLRMVAEKERRNLAKQELRRSEAQNSDSDAPPDEVSAKEEMRDIVVKIKKQKKKKLKIVVEKEENEDAEDTTNDNVVNKKRKNDDGETNKKKKLKQENNMAPEKEAGKTSKKGKKDKKNGAEGKEKKNIIKENLSEQDLKRIEKKKQKRVKQMEKRKKKKAEQKLLKEQELEKQPENGTENNNETPSIKNYEKKSFSEPHITPNTKKNNDNRFPKKPFERTNNFNKPDKKGKVRDKEQHPRKKPFMPHKMFINGKELEIDYVEGFPVKKEDAERLKKLKKDMISKGLPRSEINIALKLERRKAEKALTREKKKVCFNCRKSGHNLSECPELNKDQVAHTAGSGICFKCGSTEHTHFECKVVRGQEFKFAQCFVCNEQGHIARQCPDNARGLYPKGGACNVCGDVTHLKKDCPRYQAQQQRQDDNFKIETFGNGNPDVLDEADDSRKGAFGNKKPNKIVKF